METAARYVGMYTIHTNWNCHDMKVPHESSRFDQHGRTRSHVPGSLATEYVLFFGYSVLSLYSLRRCLE
ncbi:hypothetical protein LMH87_005733 [Akanthomyces muscarius]|uniref:Uncharacterized protein n=1 Tax=Akanthomyces muscarius TaxID=2231603 RepID=A0A9W8QPS7_AKAMU|nr:hypothetical protein LMH87_005733 [Akanthomyces muscarius]KAJ4164042.1 hypothetical protein LMH87_005733 [Akanthomyces muscarius]